MTRLLVTAVTVLLAATAARADTVLYVSVAAEKRIAVYQVDGATGKYVSNRGHDSIACFALDDEGKVSSLGQEPTEKTPRSFDLDPSGKFLFAAGESSGKLAVYGVDGKSGRLKRLRTYEVGKTPWWVLAVEVRPQ